MGELDSVAQLAERACKLYRDNGTVDTAAMVLDKAAKIIEGTRPQRAADLYKQAVDIALVRIVCMIEEVMEIYVS
jgi:hypothetical protein